MALGYVCSGLLIDCVVVGNRIRHTATFVRSLWEGVREGRGAQKNERASDGEER